jgi:hypothetical protein
MLCSILTFYFTSYHHSLTPQDLFISYSYFLLWLVLLNISIRRSYMLVSSFSHSKRLFPVMPVISLFLTLLILSHRHHRYVPHFTLCRCFFLFYISFRLHLRSRLLLFPFLLYSPKISLFLFCLTDITD